MPCRFLLTDYRQAWTDDGLRISLTTDEPVNLTLRWTDNQTWMHLLEEISRGLRKRKVPYFCFVEWNDIPQLQSGDTLVHDFIFPGWST